jgi:hypothetical protein
MARPLWKDLRRAQREGSIAGLPTLAKVPLPPRPHWKLAIASTCIAIAALVLNQTQTHGFALLSSHGTLRDHAWSGATAGAFLVFGVIAIRRLSTQVSRLFHIGAGPTAANAIRLVLTIAGLVVVLITAIIMIGVNPGHLLAAAGLTGVILGLAAQQSLGNVFAGIVLMVARPFTVGQRIRVRSGSFGGIFDAEVLAMGLTYVELLTDDGPLRVPNLGMLAAAVGPAPAPKPEPDQQRLYVNRALQKRPPRSSPPAPGRRVQPGRRPAGTVRRPREIIRQMRSRAARDDHPAGRGGGPEPGSTTGGPRPSGERPAPAPPQGPGETGGRPSSPPPDGTAGSGPASP